MDPVPVELLIVFRIQLWFCNCNPELDTKLDGILIELNIRIRTDGFFDIDINPDHANIYDVDLDRDQDPFGFFV